MWRMRFITFVIATVVTWPGAACAQSGVEGYVLLGPTCPVERMPPDPRCAPRSYQTTIDIYQSSVQVATVSTDANGYFRAFLSPGSYELRARGGQVLPRCVPQSVVVPSTGFVAADISCDTGIR